MSKSKTVCFATTPKGVEGLLANELRSLGAEAIREQRGGVSFAPSANGGASPLEMAYRVCLFSRLANRVLLPLATFEVVDAARDLYDGVRTIDWSEHLTPRHTLAVDFVVGVGSAAGPSGAADTHTLFGAQRVKDAIVDQLRDRFGTRPSVDLARPDVRVNVFARGASATVAIDLSGDSLHRRGYRAPGEQSEAPLKENLAAALLVRAGFVDVARAGGSLLDPLCGSGTFLLEAALIAADIAPGLIRAELAGTPRPDAPRFGFVGWLGHDAKLFRALVEEARGRRAAGLEVLKSTTAADPAQIIVGSDRDRRSIELARASARRAGVGAVVRFELGDAKDFEPPRGAREGLVIANPPYAERLGTAAEVTTLYETLGKRLREHFKGWRAAVLVGERELGYRFGLRATSVHRFKNGALDCTFLRFDIKPDRFLEPRAPRAASASSSMGSSSALGPGGEQLANRLRKNLRVLGRRFRREGITCYRLYDADLPDYAVAVDLYGDRVHVQEYAPPPEIDPARADSHLEEAIEAVSLVLGTPKDRVAVKVRRRQRGAEQYQRHDTLGEFHTVVEGPWRFLVNLTDYLDTGLFLDQRLTRRLVAELAPGKRFLNLFAYTGTMSVCAAVAGAASTLTVDVSKTYLDWAERNLAVNAVRLGRAHELERADCLDWIGEHEGRYDLIFLDPPTFSNSKRTPDRTFDVLRDHVSLILETARLLDEDGILLFSTNARRFKLDTASLDRLEIEDRSRATLPPDFERSARMHRLYVIRHLP